MVAPNCYSSSKLIVYDIWRFLLVPQQKSLRGYALQKTYRISIAFNFVIQAYYHCYIITISILLVSVACSFVVVLLNEFKCQQDSKEIYPRTFLRKSAVPRSVIFCILNNFIILDNRTLRSFFESAK